MELNKIFHGESLSLLKELDDNSVDLVITSPPYADLKVYIDNPGILADNYVEWFLPYCNEICRVIKPTGSFILNINDKVEGGFRHPYVFELISEIHKRTDLKLFERLFNWEPNPKGALPTTLINISSEAKRIADNHVAVYPVELVDYFIKGSTDEGDLVLDPFMGTGTTAVSSKKLGRNFIGFEKQIEYIEVANKRIKDYVENN